MNEPMTGMTLHLPKRRGRPPLIRIKPEISLAGFDSQTDYKEFLAHCAMRLDIAAGMRAGAMDSESRSLELAKHAREIVVSVARDLRAKL